MDQEPARNIKLSYLSHVCVSLLLLFRGCRKSVVRILAGCMDPDPDKAWDCDMYYLECQNFTSRISVHVFCCHSRDYFLAYMKPDDK